MSFGSSGSKNTSKPLTPEERSALFSGGMGDITGSINQFNTTGDSGGFGKFGNRGMDVAYDAPAYQYTSPYQGLSGGDYDALQQNLYQGATAGLDRYAQEGLQDVNQSVADRGLWSSGVAVAAENDFRDSIADNYQSAGANAAATRYGLQAQDLSQQNAFNQAESQFGNQFNLQNANQEYNAKWAPLDYLAALWNGTSGVSSSSKSSGFNIGF